MSKRGDRGSSIILVMMILLGLSLIAVSISSAIRSSYMYVSGRVIKTSMATQVVDAGWEYINTHTNEYFAATDKHIFINFRDLPYPLNLLKGRIKFDLYYVTPDPSTGNFIELKGFSKPPEGYDVSVSTGLQFYFYTLVMRGKIGDRSVFAGPGASVGFSVLLRQWGVASENT